MSLLPTQLRRACLLVMLGWPCASVEAQRTSRAGYERGRVAAVWRCHRWPAAAHPSPQRCRATKRTT